MKRIISSPLLHDHHTHVSLYAALGGVPSLAGLSRDEARDLLSSLPADRLNLVKDWRTDRLPLAQAELEALPPVLIVNASLHGYALNRGAVSRIGPLWPEFAEHAFDAAWSERSLPDLFVFYGQVAGLDAAKLSAFMEGLAAKGIGSAEDMTIAGEAAIKIIARSPYAERTALWATPLVFRGLSPEARAACSGIKIFLDGSLGARSAALDAALLDGQESAPLYTDGEMEAILTELSSYKKKLSIHALGHAAIEQALRLLARVERDAGAFPMVRLEHVQFITKAQARQVRDRGYRLSMQPNFSADSVDYADRLLPRHCAENNPFRMLIDGVGFKPGEDLVFGSDGMPHGLEESLQWGLFPSQAGQVLSEAEVLKGHGVARGQRDASEPKGPVQFLIDEAAKKARLIG
jgi:predicted amidohydrolase YtcJ